MRPSALPPSRSLPKSQRAIVGQWSPQGGLPLRPWRQWRQGDGRAVAALVAAAGMRPRTRAGDSSVLAEQAIAALAVEKLAHVARDGDSATAGSVEAKVVAVGALAVAAAAGTPGAEWVVGVIAACVEDWHAVVRAAAVEALAQVATDSDASAAAVAARRAALCALVPPARRGASRAVSVLAEQAAGAPPGGQGFGCSTS